MRPRDPGDWPSAGISADTEACYGPRRCSGSQRARGSSAFGLERHEVASNRASRCAPSAGPRGTAAHVPSVAARRADQVAKRELSCASCAGCPSLREQTPARCSPAPARRRRRAARLAHHGACPEEGQGAGGHRGIDGLRGGKRAVVQGASRGHATTLTATAHDGRAPARRSQPQECELAVSQERCAALAGATSARGRGGSSTRREAPSPAADRRDDWRGRGACEWLDARRACSCWRPG